MIDSLFAQTIWDTHGAWIVPLVGVVACTCAYLLGRRYLVSHTSTSHDSMPVPQLGHFFDGILHDRRVAPRRRGNTVEIRVQFPGIEAEKSAWIVDRSIGGLGVVANEPFPVGAMAKVRPATSKEMTAWNDVVIRSCRRNGSDYEVGLQFNRTPDWNTLLQFG